MELTDAARDAARDAAKPSDGIDAALVADSGGAIDAAQPADGGATAEAGGIVYGPEDRSCEGMAGTECQGESCCTSIVVPGGEYPMGRQTEICEGCTYGCPPGEFCSWGEEPEHPTSVSSFALDRYEVTVGRFAAFVDAYEAGWRPGAGDGANVAVEKSLGLAAGESGWNSAWDSKLPEDRAGLEANIVCRGTDQTWGAGGDTYPMNCVSWYEALAFCIWDGGRLPTEAEWEYAAAGGEENRVYPWGNDVTEPLPANYSETDNSPLVAVGSHPDGNGRWGHADLAGSVYEWVFDWYTYYWYTATSAGCSDCANLSPDSAHVLRGGFWYGPAENLRAAFRGDTYPDPRHQSLGFRCARAPFWE